MCGRESRGRGAGEAISSTKSETLSTWLDSVMVDQCFSWTKTDRLGTVWREACLSRDVYALVCRRSHFGRA